jgi:hypothetical protein
MVAVRSRLLVALYFVFSGLLAVGQVKIEGLLLNEEDNSPIAFANIGILDTRTGTISNEDGTFEIMIPANLMNETLLFSALGFEKRSIPVQALAGQKKLVIKMREQTTILKNVVVKSRRKKPARTFEMGNALFNSGSIYVDSVAAGSAMALLIENKHPTFNPALTVPFFVRKAKLRINYNTFDNFKVRLRFMSVDERTGLPDQDLFHESIVATSGIRKGWVNFDLSSYNIRIDQPSFFLVFEWLIEDDDRRLLMEMYREFERLFPRRVTVDTLQIDDEQITYHSYHGYRAGTSFACSSDRYVVDSFKCYYRNNSYGKWRRSSTILTANVVVVNY